MSILNHFCPLFLVTETLNSFLKGVKVILLVLRLHVVDHPVHVGQLGTAADWVPVVSHLPLLYSM